MTSGKANKIITFRSIINFILSVALAAVFLYVAFYNVNFSDVWFHVAKANLFWVIVFAILVLFGHFLRALRWKYILHSVKPDAKLKNLFGSLMVGYGVNSVTPKLGELTRAVLMGRWEGISRSSMFGTVILERVIDIISLAFAILIAVLISSISLYEQFPWLKTTLYTSAAIIISVLMLIYLAVRFQEKFYTVIIKLFGKISGSVALSVAHIFNMLTEGFNSLKGTRNYFFTIVLTVLIMSVYAFTSYIGFLMLGITEVNFGMGWVIMSISAIGVVIPTPGATGSYHTLAKSTLVLVYGFTEVIALAYAFLTHIISYSIAIVGSIICFFILNKQKTKPLSNNQTESEK
ncbi:MAG: flippase-like domain-containing protein [Ignavibacterium sp.]|nr:flippase-like domain-containing protein [Ignavibacterium sp.]